MPWVASACLQTPVLLAGDLPAVQWLNQQGVQWGAHTMAAAAEAGQLETMHFLHSSGCDWDVSVANAAARAGQLAVLQWMAAQQPACPFAESCCHLAAAAGQLEALQWLLQAGCPWPNWTRCECMVCCSSRITANSIPPACVSSPHDLHPWRLVPAQQHPILQQSRQVHVTPWCGSVHKPKAYLKLQ